MSRSSGATVKGEQRKGKAGKGAHDKARSHPWRDNIEAVTVSIVIIVLFKYFVLEAYKIPTGSMQPTLMGWEGADTGVFDRVLVDKLSYHYRDPERWEVVVFNYPLDRSKNFIKRIVGMPGETLEIRGGDVFHSVDGGPPTVLRRDPPVQRSMLKRLDIEGEWQVAGGWSADGDALGGEGAGSARFPRTSHAVMDTYTDGYPGKLGMKISTRGKRSGANAVADLRVTGSVRAAAGCREVQVEFLEGPRTYTLILPGPAAPEDARPRIEASGPDIEPRSAEAAEPRRLPAGRAVSFGGQNLDDLVQLELGGEVLAELEVPAGPPPSRGLRTGVQLASAGAGARFSGLAVHRDVYYTDAGQKYVRWEIPEGHYVMLGDNTQDSSDGRDWTLARFEITDDDGERRVVRGNQRSGENPITVTQPLGETTVFLVDELGERHVFRRDRARALTPEQASLVPRELIRGRAVLVVWPMVPSLDVYRLKWVR